MSEIECQKTTGEWLSYCGRYSVSASELRRDGKEFYIVYVTPKEIGVRSYRVGDPRTWKEALMLMIDIVMGRKGLKLRTYPTRVELVSA